MISSKWEEIRNEYNRIMNDFSRHQIKSFEILLVLRNPFYYCSLFLINILLIEYLKFIFTIYRRVHIRFWIVMWKFLQSPQKKISVSIRVLNLFVLILWKKLLKLANVIVFHPATRVYTIHINTLIRPFLPLTGKRNAIHSCVVKTIESPWQAKNFAR